MLLYQFLFSQILNITPPQNAKMLIGYFHTKSIIHSSKKLKQTKFTLQFHQTITITHINRKSIFAKHLARIIACHVALLLNERERKRERVVFSRDTIITVDREGLVARGFDGIRGPAFEKSRVAE